MTPKSKFEFWNQTYVIEGEPHGCARALAAVCSTLHADAIRADNDANTLRTMCSAFPLGNKQVIVLTAPNAELTAALSGIIAGTAPRCAGVVVYWPDAYMDRRTSFAAEAVKRKRIYEYPYYVIGDSESLKKYLTDWEIQSGVKIAVKAKPWLLAHAPLRQTNVRGTKGVREETVYDIPALESDLDKLALWAQCENRDVLSADDLEMGIWQSEIHNQWDFCDAFIAGEHVALTTQLPDANYLGLVRMLVTQCHFAAQVKAGQADSSIGGAEIAAGYSYLDGSSSGYKSPHPYRVKMVAKKLINVPQQRILSLVNLCNAASLDMLAGFNHELIFHRMVLSAVDNNPYVSFADCS